MSEREISRPALADAAAVKALAVRLSECLGRESQGAAEEAGWELAHSLSDIEASFRLFLDAQLPRVLKAETRGPELYDLLLDMGEEFRQVLYHVQHLSFYRYLLDPSEERPRHKQSERSH